MEKESFVHSKFDRLIRGVQLVGWEMLAALVLLMPNLRWTLRPFLNCFCPVQGSGKKEEEEEGEEENEEEEEEVRGERGRGVQGAEEHGGDGVGCMGCMGQSRGRGGVTKPLNIFSGAEVPTALVGLQAETLA